MLEDKLAARPVGLRAIVFVEQRVMTHILAHVVANRAALVGRLTPACLYATASPATASLRVTLAEAAQRLADFSAGRANLLICTAVAEEGMDVPAANCVVRFDPMVHSVSFVQGRGRARAHDSSYVVLSERADRTAAQLAAVEQQQLALVVKTAQQVGAGGAEGRHRDKLRAAQASREAGAAELLPAAPLPAHEALARLNLYCVKTKVALQVSSVAQGAVHEVELTYESVLRKASGVGRGPSAKAARQLAAADLLASLASP